MLIRSLRLRNAIEAYYSRSDMTPRLRSLHLKSDEWKLAEYLLVLTYPFAIKGYTICAETHPTIHLVWDTYTSLFQHLEDEKVFLQQQPAGGNLELVRAIEAAHEKLSKYYTKTRGKKGDFYNFGNILDPSSKTSTYESDDWTPDDARKYREDFVRKYENHYVSSSPSRATQGAGTSVPQSLAYLAHTATRRRQRPASTTSEAEQYLKEGINFSIINGMLFVLLF